MQFAESDEEVEVVIEEEGYETVDNSEILELQVELKKLKEKKKIEDQKETERIRKLGRVATNKDKKKPTPDEIQERLIDNTEADELDEALKQLKKRKSSN